MTITTDPIQTIVPLDLYKDIHKGIRSELFALVESAGRTDPADRGAKVALSDHVRSAVELLESHAHHEDAVIQPSLEIHLPAIAEQIATDHASFDRRTEALVDLAASSAECNGADRRRLNHQLYLDVAAFAGVYLVHQDLEERVLMPALFDAVGMDGVLAMHEAILSAIPPEEMGRSLALMLPAMNVDDRCELLGPMRAGAPAEVFDVVWSLTGSVLAPADVAAVAARLGIA
jgi:hypothetical protein